MAKKTKLRQLGWAIRVRAVRGFDEHFECRPDGTARTFKTRNDALEYKRSYGSMTMAACDIYCRRMSPVRVELRVV